MLIPEFFGGTAGGCIALHPIPIHPYSRRNTKNLMRKKGKIVNWISVGLVSRDKKKKFVHIHFSLWLSFQRSTSALLENRNSKKNNAEMLCSSTLLQFSSSCWLCCLFRIHYDFRWSKNRCVFLHLIQIQTTRNGEKLSIYYKQSNIKRENGV